MANLMIFDYKDDKYSIPDIKLEDVESVFVSRYYGDETMVVELKDGTVRVIDVTECSETTRIPGGYDGHYTVKKEDLEKWNNRKNADDFSWRK